MLQKKPNILSVCQMTKLGSRILVEVELYFLWVLETQVCVIFWIINILNFFIKL